MRRFHGLSVIMVAMLFVAAVATADMSTLSANTTGSGETLLYQIFNEIYGTDLADNAELVSTYGNDNFETYTVAAGQSVTFDVEALWMDAYYTQDLSFYTSSGTWDILFGGNDEIDNSWRLVNSNNGTGSVGNLSGIGLTGQFTADETFGFSNYSYNPDNAWTNFTFYSEESLNTPNETHMLFFTTPIEGVWFAAVEDLPLSNTYSHQDFNDFVFQFSESVVPEPSSMLLLGIGISAMAIRRFRRAR